MMRSQICCIGHLTLDKVITPASTVSMPGGTAFYFSQAIHAVDLPYQLVTALAEPEWYIVNRLVAQGIDVLVYPSEKTVYFENKYSQNQDHRTQRVSQKADAFTASQLSDLEAAVYHLGPLLADDFAGDAIKTLAEKGKVSLDVQGFLRRVDGESVHPIDWAEKRDALPYVHYLKVNEDELHVLTEGAAVEEGAIMLAGLGVREVIVTLGSRGSVIYDGTTFHSIPAYTPVRVQDATGCGDTYMAGYLYRRVKGDTIAQAGRFAAAMATLKIEVSGPFSGTEAAVVEVVKSRSTVAAPSPVVGA